MNRSLSFPLVALLGLVVGMVPAVAGVFYADKTNLLVWRDAESKDHPVRTADDWKKRRAHILEAMQEVMGPLPEPDRKVLLDVKVIEEIKTEKYTRRKLTFAVEKGDRLPAYLFVPTGATGKLPAVLCLHPTHKELGKGVAAGLGPKEDRAYAVHLVEQGYVTLAPDYVNSGDYAYDPYKNGYLSATMKGIWNHSRCVDLLQSLPEVDGDRIGCIGHSLGGHNALFVGVFDERIRCIVSNCGFCSFPKYMKGDLKGWSHDGYMPRLLTAYELKPEKVPFDFTEVVAALAPRAFFASAPVRDRNFEVSGVKDCIAAAKPIYELLGAGDRLEANYPDADHNFPPEVRKPAYEWLAKWLKGR